MTKPLNELIPVPAAIPPSFVREDDRGLFVEIVNEGPWETVIHGSMNAGARMGDHYHRECRAYFYLIRGQARVEVRHLLDEETHVINLAEREGMCFLPFETHAVTYLQDSEFILLKSYRYRNDRPDIFPEPV